MRQALSSWMREIFGMAELASDIKSGARRRTRPR
jgi:hypothetical protein